MSKKKDSQAEGFARTDKSPLTTSDLVEILSNVTPENADKPIRMFSDQEGNHVRGLFMVEISPEGQITLIPHHKEV